MDIDDDVQIINGHQEINTIGNLNMLSSDFVNESVLYTPIEKPSLNNHMKQLGGKRVKITLTKLKQKHVMSTKFWRKHKLKQSNIMLICKELISLEKRSTLIAKPIEQPTKDASFLNSSVLSSGSTTDEVKKDCVDQNCPTKGESNLIPRVNMHSAIANKEEQSDSSRLSTSSKEISSISIQTSSGVQSIATRAVKISRRSFPSRPIPKDDLLDTTELKLKTPTKTYKSSHVNKVKSPLKPLSMGILMEYIENEESSKKQNNDVGMQFTLPFIDSVVSVDENEMPSLITDVHSVNKTEVECKSGTPSNGLVPTSALEKSTLCHLEHTNTPPPLMSPFKLHPRLDKQATSEMDDCRIIKSTIVSVKDIPVINLEDILPVSSAQSAEVFASKSEDISLTRKPIVVSNTNISSVSSTNILYPSAENDNSPVHAKPESNILSSKKKDNDCLIIKKEDSRPAPKVVEGKKILSPAKNSNTTDVGLRNTDIMDGVQASAEANSSYHVAESTISHLNSPPAVIPESNFVHSSENDDCLVVEKVESISTANAEALINEADLLYDDDICPTNFLQCDMKVNETEDGKNIYKDVKLLMKPSVSLERLVSDDLTHTFMRKHKLSYFSIVYCSSHLNSMELKERRIKERKISVANILKDTNLFSQTYKQPNSRTTKSTSPKKTLVAKESSLLTKIPTKVPNLKKSFDKTPLFIDDGNELNKQISINKKSSLNTLISEPLNVEHQTANATSNHITKSLPKKSTSATKHALIRPKPMSLLMEQNVESQNEHSSHIMEISASAKNHNSKHVSTPMPVAGTSILVNPMGSVALNGHQSNPFNSSPLSSPAVNTYSLTHSIFGSLTETDTSDVQQICQDRLVVTPHINQLPLKQPPPPYTAHTSFIQQPTTSQTPFLPTQLLPPASMPIQMPHYTSPVLPMNNYAPQHLSNTCVTPLPMSNTCVTPLPMSGTPVLIQPQSYSEGSLCNTDPTTCERPMLLLQQPFIPVIGGVIRQKTNAEEECNSVDLKCIGRHVISHDWLERVSNRLKNMKEVGYPDSIYSVQHTAYQLLVASGACCLTEAVSIVNSKRFRSMMFIPEKAPKYTRPTIPSVEKVILKFFPGYKMFILKRFTFSVDVDTREVIFPMPPFCLPKNTRIVDKITILLLVSPNDGFGPGLIVLPHTILNGKHRKSLSIDPSLYDWGLSGHNSGGLTRTIVNDYLTKIALPWISKIKSNQWENYLLVDKWWAVDKLSIPPEYSGFHTFGLHQMYKANYDPIDVFFNMTMQRLWGVLCRKWMNINGILTEDMFPTFFIQSLKNIYSNANIADFCAKTGLYPIDMNRAYSFTQQNFAY